MDRSRFKDIAMPMVLKWPFSLLFKEYWRFPYDMRRHTLFHHARLSFCWTGILGIAPRPTLIPLRPAMSIEEAEGIHEIQEDADEEEEDLFLSL